MKPYALIGKATLIGVASILACSAAQAADKPDARISFSGGNVAFIAGVNWGGGTLHYKGKDTALKVRGLSVGAIGLNKFSATGNVYHLKQPSDITGTYVAAEASATVGGGAGAIAMKNEKGVLIQATGTSAGAALKLGPSGMTIELK